MRDANSEMTIILSPDDPLLENSKYKIGDHFILNKLDNSFSEEIISLLDGKKVILEVLGFGLTCMGKVIYDLNVEEPEDLRWFLSEEDLDNYCLYLGSNDGDLRFTLIDL